MFEAVDRCNLLDDAFNLARATQLGYPVALNLTRYLEAELHYFPWSSVGYGLGYISSQLYTDYEFGNWRVRHWVVHASVVHGSLCRWSREMHILSQDKLYPTLRVFGPGVRLLLNLPPL